MSSSSLPPPPEAVETLDPVAQTCIGSWEAVAGIGDLLAEGRLVEAWNAVTGAIGACWVSFGTIVDQALPFLS